MWLLPLEIMGANEEGELAVVDPVETLNLLKDGARGPNCAACCELDAPPAQESTG